MRSYTVPADVGWTVEEDQTGADVVYLAPLPHGPISVLRGTAALIWLATVEGDPDDLAERVAAEAEVPVEDVRGEVEGFVSQLLARGLLTAS